MSIDTTAFTNPTFIPYGIPIDLSKDTYFKEHGFLVALEGEIDQMIAIYCDKEQCPRPVFAFTQLPEVNAFSGISPTHRVIGITLAKAILIRRYFLAALSFPNTIYTQFLGNFAAPPTIADPKDINFYSNSHAPEDAKILGIAEGFARYALLYVAAHELGHLNLGHTASKLKNGVALWDVDDANRGNAADFDSITMEFGADIYAADALANYIAMTSNDTAAGKASFLLQCAATGLDSMFYLERRVTPWSQTLLQGSHPPMQFRAIAALVRLCQFLCENGIITEPQMLNVMGGAMENAVRLYEAVTGVQRDPAEGAEYAKMIGRNAGISQRFFDRHRQMFPNASI